MASLPPIQVLSDIPAAELGEVLRGYRKQQADFTVEPIEQSNGLWTVIVRPRSDAKDASAKSETVGTSVEELEQRGSQDAEIPNDVEESFPPEDRESDAAAPALPPQSPEGLSLSPAGIKLIQAFESCKRPVGRGRFQAYYDPVGVLTIGWGHTNHHGRQFEASTVWTQRECDDVFLEDMRSFENAVRKHVNVPLSQNQFDALVSFSFNCGEGSLAASTLLKMVNRRDFSGAAGEFGKWVKAKGVVLKGLVRRRASEALLFQGIADLDYDGLPDAAAANHVDSPDQLGSNEFGLDAKFAEKLARVIEACRKLNLEFRISQGLRTPQIQAKYYCQWAQRSPQKIDEVVSQMAAKGAPWLASLLHQYRDIPRIRNWQTSALPGAGWHQWGEAADCYCYRNGKMVRNGSDECYGQYATAAQAMGLTPGLHFSKPDAGHVQLRPQAGASSLYSWSYIDGVMKERFSDKPALA